MYRVVVHLVHPTSNELNYLDCTRAYYSIYFSMYLNKSELMLKEKLLITFLLSMLCAFGILLHFVIDCRFEKKFLISTWPFKEDFKEFENFFCIPIPIMFLNYFGSFPIISYFPSYHIRLLKNLELFCTFWFSPPSLSRGLVHFVKLLKVNLISSPQQI